MPLDLSGLKRIRAGLDAAIDAGATQAATHVNELAAQLAPQDSGALSASGEITQTGSGSYSVSFGNGLPDARAVFQEYGTVNQSAQPYLTPALEAIDVEAEIAKKIKDLIQ